MKLRYSAGFSLMELVSVIAIVAVLGAIAFPSYTAYLQRGNRAAARALLEQAAMYMERQFTITNAYPDATTLSAAGFTVVPTGATGSAIKYNLGLGTPSGTTTFTLTATPTSGSVDPDCGTLSLNNVGVRNSSAGTAQQCWER